jgi:hypothetical protein
VLKWELRGERVRLEHDALLVTAPEEIPIIEWRTKRQPEECLSLDKGTEGKHWRMSDAAEQVGNSFESTRERDQAGYIDACSSNRSGSNRRGGIGGSALFDGDVGGHE